MGDQLIANTHTRARGHISMPSAGLEPMMPVFERFKTVRQHGDW